MQVLTQQAQHPCGFGIASRSGGAEGVQESLCGHGESYGGSGAQDRRTRYGWRCRSRMDAAPLTAGRALGARALISGHHALVDQDLLQSTLITLLAMVLAQHSSDLIFSLGVDGLATGLVCLPAKPHAIRRRPTSCRNFRISPSGFDGGVREPAPERCI